jgi:hypothetical protein
MQGICHSIIAKNTLLDNDERKQPRQQIESRESHVGQTLRHPLLCQHQRRRKLAGNCSQSAGKQNDTLEQNQVQLMI